MRIIEFRGGPADGTRVTLTLLVRTTAEPVLMDFEDERGNEITYSNSGTKTDDGAQIWIPHSGPRQVNQ